MKMMFGRRAVSVVPGSGRAVMAGVTRKATAVIGIERFDTRKRAWPNIVSSYIVHQ